MKLTKSEKLALEKSYMTLKESSVYPVILLDKEDFEKWSIRMKKSIEHHCSMIEGFIEGAEVEYNSNIDNNKKIQICKYCYKEYELNEGNITIAPPLDIIGTKCPFCGMEQSLNCKRK